MFGYVCVCVIEPTGCLQPDEVVQWSGRQDDPLRRSSESRSCPRSTDQGLLSILPTFAVCEHVSANTENVIVIWTSCILYFDAVSLGFDRTFCHLNHITQPPRGFLGDPQWSEGKPGKFHRPLESSCCVSNLLRFAYFGVE